MSNVKFVGPLTSFFVLNSNYGNYFNNLFFGINSILEALICSGPLTIFQFLCIKELKSLEVSQSQTIVYGMCVVF